ncbi:MAG: DNA photolyase [Candidatus Brocadia sinica]|nr:MAG: DNA photolyase [Candidatus Brocadia sinica]
MIVNVNEKKGNLAFIILLPVVYWMSRDQRASDNWALIFTQELALQQKVAMVVVFCLVPRFLDAGKSHYHFMLRGLQETEKALQKRNIPFFLLTGSPDREIPRFIKKYRVGTLMTDFNPLRIKQGMRSLIYLLIFILARFQRKGWRLMY